METYIWETNHDTQDMLKLLAALTRPPKFIDRMFFDYISFEYHYAGEKEYTFSLWYNYGFWRKISYDSPIKGVISGFPGGCRIVATRRREWSSILHAVFIFTEIAILYLLTFCAAWEELEGWIFISILLGLMATGILTRFLYTANRWKTNNPLLAFIDNLAEVERVKDKIGSGIMNNL